jgi:hypothetical protein
MQNVKAPIGKYNLFTGGAYLFQPGSERFKRHNLVCCFHSDIVFLYKCEKSLRIFQLAYWSIGVL